MATTSFPAYGDGGLTIAHWSKAFNAQDGVINNFDGTAWALTIISATNTARLGPGAVRVNGYILESDGDLDLSIPTGAGNYYIAACYDPTLNVALGDGTANPLGPVRIVCSSALDTSNGKTYTLMRRLTRAVAAGAVTSTSWLNSVGNVFTVPTMPTVKLTNPEGALGGWDHPVGSICTALDTGERYQKVPGSTVGATYWRRDSIDGPYDFPNPNSLVSQAANEQARYYFTDNGAMVQFEGTLKRSSGASLTNGADVGLGTMPVGARPVIQQRWPCTVKLAAGWDSLQVTVRPDGIVSLYNPTGTLSVDYIDLSAISYRVR